MPLSATPVSDRRVVHGPLWSAPWPNGKALLSGDKECGKDCGFESHRRRENGSKLFLCFLLLDLHHFAVIHQPLSIPN